MQRRRGRSAQRQHNLGLPGVLLGGLAGRLAGQIMVDAANPNPPPPPKGSVAPTNPDKTMPGAP